MKRRLEIVVLVGLAALAGCGSEARDAEENLAFLKKSAAAKSELCVAAHKVVAAYQAERNAEKFNAARIEAQRLCLG